MSGRGCRRGQNIPLIPARQGREYSMLAVLRAQEDTSRLRWGPRATIDEGKLVPGFHACAGMSGVANTNVHYPLVPAKAGTQGDMLLSSQLLDPRFRGDERERVQTRAKYSAHSRTPRSGLLDVGRITCARRHKSIAMGTQGYN